MPTDQIYVIEMIVNRIDLEPGVRINNLEELAVGFKFAQIINFDIDTDSFAAPEMEAGDRRIKMNYGKTFLFISKPSLLRSLLQTDPYTITVYDGNVLVGSVTRPWKKEFSEMVKFFQTLGIVKSTTAEDSYELRNKNGFVTANVDVFLRMSCYGQNVQTMFHIETDGDKQNYIFRHRNASKTFKVEKQSVERFQPLVAPLYSGITGTKSPRSVVNLRENVSLTKVFDGKDTVQPRESKYNSPEGTEYEGFKLELQDDFDILSICYKPSENKFYDLLNLMSADVKTKTKHTEVTFQRKKGLSRPFQRDQVSGDDFELSGMIEMTADKIARRLCGNKDCPAAKKFKEYGIGPLATGTGLGTLYGDVEPPVTYGMSHTYGTYCEYGPYGVFSRPKQEELPFVSLEKPEVLQKTCEMRHKSDCKKKCKKKKKDEPTWHSQSCPLCPVRLRGGADPEALPQSQTENTVMPKSPIMECKGVMDQFDHILAEYKRALGPCGQATCPYGANFSEGTCRKICDNPLPPVKESSSISCDETPCRNEDCPYAGATEPTKKRYPAGCGNPKCAYTKYKLGLVDADAELELKFLPPALGSNCGDPHCKYPLAPPLPPIHWDCPDPLPRGPCKNLNCPFQPAPLRRYKTQKQLKTGPCGSPMCPYALPQPCGQPTCPFMMRNCPMAEKKNRCPPKDPDNKCENPECPFAEKNACKELTTDIDDPTFKGEFQDCANPECPYKKKKSKKRKEKKVNEGGDGCDNPDCPANVQKTKKKKEKKKKDKERKTSEDSICSNPECPARMNASRKKNVSSSDSATTADSICSEPDCPYAELKKQRAQEKQQRRCVSSGDAGDTSSCKAEEEESICSNPDCPERKSRKKEQEVCSLPGCPYSTREKSAVCNDPKCPHIQPLPSCGIPNCPFEPVPLGYVCKNPKCPSKFVDFSRNESKLQSKIERQLQEQAQRESRKLSNMPMELNTTTVCEISQPCDEPAEQCDNPDCDMKGGNQGKELVSGSKKSEVKKVKRKKKGKFVYSFGDTYPGTKLGHRECVTPVFNVPPNMGWLWNIFTPVMRLKPRRGWRPGALTKTIAARIRAHRQAKGLGLLKVPNFRKDGTASGPDHYVKVLPKPTLQIQKKEGTYWITMNPLKDPNTLVENEDPYMECTPMTFKITKNKKDDEFCHCDDEEGADHLSTTSSDSELDIEFTPPAGIIHPERFKKRPNVACCAAQYDPKDIEKKKDDKKGKGKGKGGKGGKGKGDKNKGGKKKK